MNQERWLVLMKHFDFNENVQTYQELYKAYTQSHRRYHTVQHINAMLGHFDRVSDLFNRPYLVELAIWFHDAIYAPFSSTNEADSAVWLRRFLQDNNAPAIDVSVASDLVMATLHSAVVTENDQALLVDIDLSILGSKPSVYEQFEKDIRFEYKRVPYFLYKKKRKAVLQSFLDRESIYQTSFFADQFESNARSNMELALKKI